MKNLKFLIVITLILIYAIISPAQNKSTDIIDNDYKFSVTLPDGWVRTKKDETSKKDAIYYAFEKKKEASIQFAILGFKLQSVKDLDNFIYVIEKDATLNIPPISGEYTSFDNDTYDGKYATYKDDNSYEKIYYYRTKYKESPENYAYVVRFLTLKSNAKVEKEFSTIIESFKILQP